MFFGSVMSQNRVAIGFRSLRHALCWIMSSLAAVYTWVCRTLSTSFISFSLHHMLRLPKTSRFNQNDAATEDPNEEGSKGTGPCPGFGRSESCCGQVQPKNPDHDADTGGTHDKRHYDTKPRPGQLADRQSPTRNAIPRFTGRPSRVKISR
jgi:hypothetical protein